MTDAKKIGELLSGNGYPGRGIALGKSRDGSSMIAVYFIMGRSENSRNRIFVEDGAGIRTQAYDPAKLSDPSLIIYSPVRILDDCTIVTNGDQTDTIYEFLAKGKTFADALRTCTFEPDAPNYTPRISGLLRGESYTLSILKSENANPGYARRYFYEYDSVQSGMGHFIHTYRCDGNPIPSFEGEPVLVTLGGNIDELSKEIWENLNKQNKVSLFVRFTDRVTGKSDTRIINKNRREGT